MEVVIEHHVDANSAQDDGTNRNDLSAFLQYYLFVVVVKDPAPLSFAREECKQFGVVLQSVMPPIGVHMRRLVILRIFVFVEMCLR